MIIYVETCHGGLYTKKAESISSLPFVIQLINDLNYWRL